MPHLSVADGALDLMMRTYTDALPSLGGYLTDKGTLHFGRFERYVQRLARSETAYFEMKGGNVARRGAGPTPPVNHRQRYYLEKLGLHPKDAAGRTSLVQSYLEGLSWCLGYYHKKCPSWNWFYPDFYAPLASDLTGLEAYTVDLELGTPFPPLAQLLSVLPPQSSELVPAPYRELMLSPTSPVFDAFPADFELDANGKRNEWEVRPTGVVHPLLTVVSPPSSQRCAPSLRPGDRAAPVHRRAAAARGDGERRGAPHAARGVAQHQRR